VLAIGGLRLVLLAGLLRCGKSCRLRWINYLRAGLKRGNISEEEEDMIIKLHATLGNRYLSMPIYLSTIWHSIPSTSSCLGRVHSPSFLFD
jgi:hypothetical protein